MKSAKELAELAGSEAIGIAISDLDQNSKIRNHIYTVTFQAAIKAGISEQEASTVALHFVKGIFGH